VQCRDVRMQQIATIERTGNGRESFASNWTGTP
jgi:hypothetical protein